jgi:hypothetical protein
MNRFGVLTNRKRAIIALVHSIVFLGIAMQGFVSPKAGLLHGASGTSDYILVAIYLVVASILLWLITISRGVVERVYFALCATSASCGLVRTVFGDQLVPPAQYLRVLMLTSAVVVGIFIARSHSRLASARGLTPLRSQTFEQ